MRDILLKILNNKDSVVYLLNSTDPQRISSGQVLVTPKMIPYLFRFFSDGKIEVSEPEISSNGISLDIRTKANISLRYTFRIISAVAAKGRLIVKAKYAEEKLSSGIGAAILNLSGKSGLSFVLGKYEGVHIDGTNIEVNRQGLPEFINASYVRLTPGGIVFSVN